MISVRVARPAADVAAFVGDARTLPRWSFVTSVEPDGDGWATTSPAGPAHLRFTGVGLDHDVTLPDGTVLHVGLRVEPDGDGCLVGLLLEDGATEQDRRTAQADLERLRDLLEE